MKLFGKTICTTLAVVLLAIPDKSRAENSAYYCHALPVLLNNIKECDENAYYSLAAQNCLIKLEKDIEAKKLALTTAMTQHTLASADAQNARIGNNASNLNSLRASIESLIAQSARARQEMVLYSENFAYTSAFSKSLLDRLGVTAIVHRLPCHKNPYNALKGTVEKVDKHIAEFKQLAATVQKLETRTATNLKKVDSGSLTQKATGGRAPASPNAGGPKPAPKQGPSSITGTEKAGENERALQQKLNHQQKN